MDEFKLNGGSQGHFYQINRAHSELVKGATRALRRRPKRVRTDKSSLLQIPRQ